MTAGPNDNGDIRWFVMRDLHRANCKQLCYKILEEEGVDVFTPMVWKLVETRGKKSRVQTPAIPSLLFIRDTEERVKVWTEKLTKLQFIYVRGGRYCEPMIVPKAEMERFVRFSTNSKEPVFYRPDEITPQMCGRTIRVVGGALDGIECTLLKVKGARKKRLMVNLPGLIAVVAEVNPEYVQFVE